MDSVQRSMIRFDNQHRGYKNMHPLELVFSEWNAHQNDAAIESQILMAIQAFTKERMYGRDSWMYLGCGQFDPLLFLITKRVRPIGLSIFLSVVRETDSLSHALRVLGSQFETDFNPKFCMHLHDVRGSTSSDVLRFYEIEKAFLLINSNAIKFTQEELARLPFFKKNMSEYHRNLLHRKLTKYSEILPINIWDNIMDFI